MAGRRPQRPPRACFASDGGEPDDEQNAGRGEEGGAQKELRGSRGRRRAADGGRYVGSQSEPSARMSGRLMPIRDRRKASIRKFVAGRKGRISAGGGHGDAALIISLCPGRPSRIDRLSASAAIPPRQIAKGAPRHG